MGCNYTYDDCFVAGDTYRLVAVLKDSANEPIPLEGYKLKMQLRSSVRSGVVALEKTKTIDAVEGIEGLILIELTPAETDLLNLADSIVKYVYDVELTDPTDVEVQTILGGTFSVSLGVTR